MEIETVFTGREGVHPEIVRRINHLAAIRKVTRVTTGGHPERVLYAAIQGRAARSRAADQGAMAPDQVGRGDGDADADADADGDGGLAALEDLLESFRKVEVPEEDLATVSFDDPILLLLGQQRSFGICRCHFFCPEERFHPSRPIQSVKQLAEHMRSVHGASTLETADMMNHFIGMLLPGPIGPVIVTSKR
jgi:hypothetical protein